MTTSRSRDYGERYSASRLERLESNLLTIISHDPILPNRVCNRAVAMTGCRAANLPSASVPTAELRFVLIAARGAAASHFVITAMTITLHIRA
jgi:hypothetical protein